VLKFYFCYLVQRWNVISLRYFNPIGNHSSATFGEHIKGRPHNLMSSICMAALGKIESVTICGDDYPTPDGSALRDYVHVADLASSHVETIKLLTCGTLQRFNAFNISSGLGTSVLELLHTFESTNNVSVPFTIVPRRSTDIAISFGCPQKAATELNWRPKLSLATACRDTWNWLKHSNWK